MSLFTIKSEKAKLAIAVHYLCFRGLPFLVILLMLVKFFYSKLEGEYISWIINHFVVETTYFFFLFTEVPVTGDQRKYGMYNPLAEDYRDPAEGKTAIDREAIEWQNVIRRIRRMMLQWEYAWYKYMPFVWLTNGLVMYFFMPEEFDFEIYWKFLLGFSVASLLGIFIMKKCYFNTGRRL